MSIYKKVNLKKDKFEVDMVLLIKDKEKLPQALSNLREGMQKVELAEQTYFTAEYIGPYSFLGFAWSNAFSNLKMKKHSFHWPKPSLEIYLTNPEDEPKDLITVIYIPVKK